MGIEPTTFCLGSRHSTTELRPLAGYGVGLCMRSRRAVVKVGMQWRAWRQTYVFGFLDCARNDMRQRECLPVISLTYIMDRDKS